MEAKTTTTNAAQSQSTTNTRNVTFSYSHLDSKNSQQDEQQARPNRGGRGRGSFKQTEEDGDQKPQYRGRRGGRGGYNREQNPDGENRETVYNSDEAYTAKPRNYNNRDEGETTYRGRGGDRGARGRGNRGGRGGVRNWEQARPAQFKHNDKDLASDEEEVVLTQEEMNYVQAKQVYVSQNNLGLPVSLRKVLFSELTKLFVGSLSCKDMP